jgi:hypothetical protein
MAQGYVATIGATYHSGRVLISIAEIVSTARHNPVKRYNFRGIKSSDIDGRKSGLQLAWSPHGHNAYGIYAHRGRCNSVFSMYAIYVTN